MDRINHPTATAGRLFTPGDPTAVPAVPATRVTADIMNAMQEELCSIVENEGMALDGSSCEQVYRAILGIAVQADLRVVDHSDPSAVGSIAWLIAEGRACVMLRPGNYDIVNDLVVPAGVTLDFLCGAAVSVASGKTLTINGGLRAGLHQIFSGAGTVAGSPKVSRVLPQWWGATGDGTTDDTVAVQKAINFVAQAGGGKAYFAPGTYIVHNGGADLTQGGSNPTACALISGADNVWLEGAGRELSVLKAQVADAYSILYLRTLPIVNGAVDIVGGGVRGLCFDGTYDISLAGAADNGNALIFAQGLKDYVIEDCWLKNSPDYGLGLQNGGFQNLLLRNLLIEDVANDAIDVKNNGSAIRDCRVDHITIRRFGRATNAAYPFAGLDLMGEGWTVSNIHVEEFGDIGDVEAAIRFKEGESEDPRGRGAHYSTLTNFYINGASGGSTNANGVKVSAYQVAISNGSIRNCPGAGVLVEQQESVVTGVQVVSCGNGFWAKDSAYATNGDRATFSGCVARSNTGIGFLLGADGATVCGCISRSNEVGVQFDGANNRWLGGEIANNTTKSVDNNVVTSKIRDAYGFLTTTQAESAPFDITTTGSKSVAIPHGLSFVPEAKNCAITLKRSANNAGLQLDHMRITSVDAININCQVTIRSASATGGDTATLLAMIDASVIPLL